jgi:glycosyltransferase involved in cell wall biosynthesis
MKFTVAIIGRNEEDVILRCLKSVKEADEILYMDTGSTDKTMKEVKKYKGSNLKILTPYKWIDNFSHARNACTQQAKNDWILTIDCDEQLQKGAVKVIERELKNYAEMPNFNGFKLNVMLPNETSPQWRVHRKSNLWTRPAHNRLTTVSGFVPLNVTIIAGQGSSHTYDPNMRRRIITNYLHRDNPTDAEMWYYLGREYMKVGDLWGAIEKFQNARRFTYMHYSDLYLDGLYLLAQCYYILEKTADAQEVLGHLISINPDFRLAVELLARINYRWAKNLEHTKNKDVLINRSPITLMDEKKINKRVAQLATLPDREDNLKKVLESIIPYVDEVYVMLNNYKAVPEWIKKMERVKPVLRKNEKGDAEKFLDVEKRKGCMIYILDDDLIYNETFFSVSHDTVIRRRCVTSYSGAIINNGKETYNFSTGRDVQNYNYVNLVGTDSMAFTLDDLPLSYADIKSDFCSKWVSSLCEEKKVGMMIIPHLPLKSLDKKI